MYAYYTQKLLLVKGRLTRKLTCDMIRSEVRRMNAINDLYDIIDALRKKYYMSSRLLATAAEIPPTTLASIMSRRPATMDKEILDRIATVFHVSWYQLLNKSKAFAAAYENELRVPTAMSKEDVDQVYEQIVQPIIDAATFRGTARLRADVTKAWCPGPARYHGFQDSIQFVLGKLNDDGLMEAMRRVLDVANDPKYCKPL